MFLLPALYICPPCFDPVHGEGTGRSGFFLRVLVWKHLKRYAEVAKLVDAHVSGACVARHAGSSPAFGTRPAPTRCR